MYKISIKGEAEVFFPSFERAFNHLNRKYHINQSIGYNMRELIEDGIICSLEHNLINFEKVSL